ncbi:MAG: hypothetical protein ACUVX8_10475 [Candidatus Zipacnadales bacterium]
MQTSPSPDMIVPAIVGFLGLLGLGFGMRLDGLLDYGLGGCLPAGL